MLQAFTTGFRRAIAEPKMVLVVYLLNLLLAIPLALGVRSVLISGFGASLAPSQLLQGIDFTVLQDYMNAHSEELGAVVRQILSFLVLAMLLQTFLAGGILAVVQDQERKYSASLFFRGCGVFFFRFFRLFLLFGVTLLLVAFIFGGLLGAIVTVMTENAVSEVTDFWTRIGATIIFLLPIILILMAADYAKIHMVLHDERSALRSAGKAFVFVFRRFVPAFGLEFVLLLIPAALFAAYALVDLAVGMTSGLSILLMFIIQQCFMVLRAWTKVLFFSSELMLYRDLQRLPLSDIDLPISASGTGKHVIV